LIIFKKFRYFLISKYR